MQQSSMPQRETGRAVNDAGDGLGPSGPAKLKVAWSDSPSTASWITTVFVQIVAPPAIPHAVGEPKADPLSTFRTSAERVIVRHGGDIASTDGDSIVALFKSSGHVESHTDKVIQAAVDLMDQLSALNKDRVAKNLLPFRLGIGLDTGCVAIRKFKRHSDLSAALEIYVTRARGLSVLNRQTPFPAIFISENTFEGLGADGSFFVQSLGKTLIPDHAEPVTVYALMHPVALFGSQAQAP